MGRRKNPPSDHVHGKDDVVKPTLTYRIAKWALLASTVGLAIGILALIDQYLIYLPFTYDGPDPRYQGQTVNLFYCMLSSSKEGSQGSRCSFATATAAVGLGLSLLWLVYGAGNKHTSPHKHRQRICSCSWITLLALWWLAAAIVLTIWTDQANKAGLPRTNQRNGLCVMAWAEFLFFGALSTMLFLVVSDKMAKKVFTKKPKEPKPGKDAAAAGAVAAAPAVPAAPAAAATQLPVTQQPQAVSPAVTAAHGPAAEAAAAGGGNTAGGAWGPAHGAAGPAGPAAAAGAPGNAGPAAAAAVVDENPFRGGAQPAEVPVGPNAV